ncbi:hypothetical protein GUJ93_ZPchr0006g44472 [Zizania palustris]|uniref:Uncharacterized protein n=1 Tax=Zizania palustris TaxID=103762 RepID=A0A8J5SHQ1_ZIZPA|nr:hypothetical protein GUJ93_ZPchr0006g44472 [Zizania palustris]
MQGHEVFVSFFPLSEHPRAVGQKEFDPRASAVGEKRKDKEICTPREKKSKGLVEASPGQRSTRALVRAVASDKTPQGPPKIPSSFIEEAGVDLEIYSVDPSMLPDPNLARVVNVSISTTYLVVFATPTEQSEARKSLDLPSIEGDGATPPNAEAS